MKKRSSVVEVVPAAFLRRFTKEQAEALASNWLEAFGEDSHGVNAKAYMWHIFSGGRYDSLSGQVARAEYEKHLAPSYIVLGNDRHTAIETEERPTACSLSDFYVFPPNLAWTMAFTHEDGWLGPYFARNRSYEQLNQDNLAKLRKAKEAALAKSKGWHRGDA